MESNDNFKKKNFDSLMLMCHPHVSWVEYRLNGKPERFIKIGLGGVGLRPKDFYNLVGNLVTLLIPVEDEHFVNLWTKSQKNPLTILLAEAVRSTMKNSVTQASTITPPKKSEKGQSTTSKTLSPKVMLFDYIPPTTYN